MRLTVHTGHLSDTSSPLLRRRALHAECPRIG
jgi:hypothetical protein